MDFIVPFFNYMQKNRLRSTLILAKLKDNTITSIKDIVLKLKIDINNKL